MTSLASTDALETRLGRTLSTTESDRAEALLADASAAIRHYTGQQFDLATTTDRLWVRRNRVLLPQRPVNDVTAVTGTDGADVTYLWHGAGFDHLYLGTTTLVTTTTQRRTHAVVDVTYSHGYDQVPDDVIAVCCSVALRTFGVEPDSTGMQSENIEGYSYTLGTVAAAGSAGLLPEEKRALDVYRRTVGFIDGGRL